MLLKENIYFLRCVSISIKLLLENREISLTKINY